MLSELHDIVTRIRVHWHAVVVAVITMVPLLLQQLDGVDLTPILSYLIPEHYVPLVVSLLPFVLVVMRPMVHLEDTDPDV